MASGSRADHWRSSNTSRPSTSPAPPPSTNRKKVVTRAAAKLRRTFKSRRTRCTRGSAIALRARASRKGINGPSSHRKKITAPTSQSTPVIVLCKKTLNCDI